MRIVFAAGLPYMEPEYEALGPTWSIVYKYRWFWDEYELLHDEYGEVVRLQQDLSKETTTYIIAARGIDAAGDEALLVRILSRRDCQSLIAP